MMLYCINTDLDNTHYQTLPHQFDQTPDSVLTPSVQHTRIGELEIEAGMPSSKTIHRVSDYQQFHCYVGAAMQCLPVAILSVVKHSLQKLGLGNDRVGVFMQGPDSRSLLLAANPRVVYALSWLEVAQTPLVIEMPPGTIGSIHDAVHNRVAETGYGQFDGGRGGKYLLVGPQWQGNFDESEYTAVFLSSSFGNCLVVRGFLSISDSEAILRNFSRHLKIYPLGESSRRATLFNLSGVKFSMLPAYDEKMFDQVNRVIQYEHPNFISSHATELLRRIGIKKGKPFLRDMNQQQLLAEAAAVAHASARVQLYFPDKKSRYIQPDKQWFSIANDGFQESSSFNDFDTTDKIAACVLLASSAATLPRTKNLVELSCMAVNDANSKPLHGDKQYRVRIPAAIKTDKTWLIALYDVQHFSMLITSQSLPSLGSHSEGLQKNTDGSVDLFFSPQPPDRLVENWIQTNPNGYWFAIFRICSEQRIWQNKCWSMPDIEQVNNI